MAANTQVFFFGYNGVHPSIFYCFGNGKTFYDKIKQQSKWTRPACNMSLVVVVCFCLDDEDVPAVVLYMITNVVIFGWFQWH